MCGDFTVQGGGRRLRAIHSDAMRPTASGTRRARRSTSTSSSTTRPRSRARRSSQEILRRSRSPSATASRIPAITTLSRWTSTEPRGSVEPVAGVWRFVPSAFSLGQGSIMIMRRRSGRRASRSPSSPPGRTRSAFLNTGKTYRLCGRRCAWRIRRRPGGRPRPAPLEIQRHQGKRDGHEGRASFPRRPSTVTATAATRRRHATAAALRCAVEAGAPKVIDGAAGDGAHAQRR